MKAFDNINKFAKQQGLSLQEVARRAGLSENVIYQYKSQTKPTDKTLAKIAPVLGVTVDDLKGINIEDDLNKAIDNARSFDGKPISDKDREKVKNILRGYFED